MKVKRSVGIVFDDKMFHLLEVKKGRDLYQPGALQTFSLEHNTVLYHLERLGSVSGKWADCAVGVLSHHFYQLFHVERPAAHVNNLNEWAMKQVGDRLVFASNQVILEVFESALPSFVFLLVLHRPVVQSLVAQVRESPCIVNKIVPLELALSRVLAYAYPKVVKLAFLYVEGATLRIIVLLNGSLVYAGIVFNYVDTDTLSDPLSLNTVLINIEAVITTLLQHNVIAHRDELSFYYTSTGDSQINLSEIQHSFPQFSVVNSDDFLGLSYGNHKDCSIHALMALGGGVSAFY